MSLFDDMMGQTNDNKGQQIKSNEITGDRFMFHSLPKEFSDMSNNLYIQEKNGQRTVDKNVVSKALLNGYMWKSIGDGSLYAIMTAIAAMACIIKWKISGGWTGFFFSALFYVPFMIFVGYHSIFYSIIKAQVVGPVTKALANATSYTYFATFFSVFSALMAVFIFCVSMIKDILLLFFMLINKIGRTASPGSYKQSITDGLIWFHNLLVEIAFDGTSIFENIYFISAVTFLFSVAIVLIYDRKYFVPAQKDIEAEYKKTTINQGYPIESAQSLMRTWRAEHGV